MANKTEPKRPGRPPVVIDERTIEGFGQIHATQEDIAIVLGCNRRTVLNRLKEQKYQQAFERGKAMGRLSLKRLQWRHAQGTGSSAVNMTIHMSKHLLGETDKTALDVSPVELVITRIERVIIDSSQDQHTESLPALVAPKALQGR